MASMDNKHIRLSVPGAVSTYPNAVNKEGDILGLYYDAQVTAHPFFAKCAKGKLCTGIKN